MLRALQNGRTPPENPSAVKKHPYRMIELPANLPGIRGWNFDIEGFNRKLASQLVRDKQGFSRMKTPEYDAAPGEDNLLAPNPTIRTINRRNEEFATEQLDAAKYPRCDHLRKQALEPDQQDSKELTFKCWEVGDNLYFSISADFTGAWNPRYYCFRPRLDGRLLAIASFDELPNADVARIVNGVKLASPKPSTTLP